jgi:hypothetical protein
MKKLATVEGRKIFFTVSPRSSNGLLAILKNALELEQFTYRNQDFTQGTKKRKLGGPQRNLTDISVSALLILLHYSPKPRGKWQCTV